jgi:titin
MILLFSGAPNAPELLEVTSLEKDSASIRWKRPKFDGGAQITNYLIEKREEFKDDWTKVKQVDNFQFNYQIRDLVPDKKYYFRVTAKNSIGLGEPCELQEPVVPSRPAGKLLFLSQDFSILKCYFLYIARKI